MVYFRFERAPELVAYAQKQGILALALAADTIRVVAHLDVSMSDIERAIQVFAAFR